MGRRSAAVLPAVFWRLRFGQLFSRTTGVLAGVFRDQPDLGLCCFQQTKTTGSLMQESGTIATLLRCLRLAPRRLADRRMRVRRPKEIPK